MDYGSYHFILILEIEHQSGNLLDTQYISSLKLIISNYFKRKIKRELGLPSLASDEIDELPV